jgi:hypothetical protein
MDVAVDPGAEDPRPRARAAAQVLPAEAQVLPTDEARPAELPPIGVSRIPVPTDRPPVPVPDAAPDLPAGPAMSADPADPAPFVGEPLVESPPAPTNLAPVPISPASLASP